MWSENLVELENSLEAECSDSRMDGNTLQQGDAITNGNVGGKLAEVWGITGVVAGTKDYVLALQTANKEVETLCGVSLALLTSECLCHTYLESCYQRSLFQDQRRQSRTNLGAG